MSESATMPYRRLGPTGLQVSLLSFGSWVTFKDQMDVGLSAECMAAAREAGVNFFDNAEVYAGGESERVMGEAIARLDGIDNDRQLAEALLHRAGVAVVPGSGFGAPGRLRVSFAADMHTIETGLRRLREFLR